MLQHLEIENFALIESLSIDFERGFTVLTGQTGSGKSVLLEALSLALGARADRGSLRDAEKKCLVEAVFDLKGIERDLSLEGANDSQLILRRIILPNGTSRAFVNDIPVRLEVLEAWRHILLDIHAQSEHTALRDPDFVIELLDGLGNHASSLESYKKTYHHYQTLKKEETLLREAIAASKAQYGYLQDQLKDFAGVDFDGESLETLEKNYSELEESQQVAQEMQGLLETGDGINLLLETYQERLGKMPEAVSEVWKKRMESLILEFEDLSEEVRQYGAKKYFDENAFRALEEKLSAIYRLQKRHQIFDLEGLSQLKIDLQQKLKLVDMSESVLQEKSEDVREAERQLEASAQKLQNLRKAQEKPLIEFLNKGLPSLGIIEANMSLQFQVKDFSPNGVDDITLLYAPHKSLTPKPLAQIGSGGELSRIMLLLKVLQARYKRLPTLIFDEIDTGVSGVVADQVGHLLQNLGENHQVIAITHLPQVSSLGDHHFKIFKAHESDSAYTRIISLTREERIQEIAQMLSGEKVTQEALKQAEGLLGKL